MKFFKNLDLEKITIILGLICFTYQLIELTLEFTEYKTTIYVEFSEEKINFTDYPAYSMCTYQLNKDSIELLKKKFEFI